jgi:DNA-binding MurR/RpiR family transcriptional regulator
LAAKYNYETIVAHNVFKCNSCIMTLSVLERLALAAREQPPKQARVAQYVVDHVFEATTSPMRSLARNAKEIPATFTRMAQTLGFSGWEELRAELTAVSRADVSAATQGPYSSRKLPSTSGQGLVPAMLRADTDEIGTLDTRQFAHAASLLEGASGVVVAGFRSCRAPAALFHYLYRLFRPDVSLIGGSGGLLDLELGNLHKSNVVVLFGFDPYSRDSLLTARAAATARCGLLAIVDSPQAPIASDASVILPFGTQSPGFFPSLTACVALVQALIALLYARSGDVGRRRLRETEKRIAAHTAYLDPKTEETD